MSFDTPTFWIFFCVVWIAWRYLPFGAAKASALFASLLFYAWWNPWFLSLIGLSAVVDFQIGKRMGEADDPSTRQRLLVATLLMNLGLLAIFKYGPFAVANASGLAELFGFEVDWELANWVIPVGISFYTFQTLSYSIDIYRGRLRPVKSFRDFFLFVSFFPQLVAGPIVRAGELLPQFESRRRILPVAVQAGFYYVISGLFLKIVIADNLASHVERVFKMSAIETLSPTEAWLGAIYFSIQIFADFAGYSGIAIGLAYLMGLRFPKNFDYPYISAGLSEFWTRWHISLSSWLRDYLYIPLGGNRHGAARMLLALMLTMLLGGLWHGPAWTFVAWGGLHGLGLVIERALRGGSSGQKGRQAPKSVGELGGRLGQMALTYVFVLVTWVFFRAESFPMATGLLERMFIEPFRGGWHFEHLQEARPLVLVGAVALLHLAQLSHEWWGLRKGAWLRATVAAAFLLLLTVVERNATPDFIYFQF